MIKRYWCSPEGVMVECGLLEAPRADDFVEYAEYAKLQTEVELLRAATTAPRVAPVSRPFQRGDAVKLIAAQTLVTPIRGEVVTIGEGEPCTFISEGPEINWVMLCAVELTSAHYQGVRLLTRLSNLERV